MWSGEFDLLVCVFVWNIFFFVSKGLSDMFVIIVYVEYIVFFVCDIVLMIDFFWDVLGMGVIKLDGDFNVLS